MPESPIPGKQGRITVHAVPGLSPPAVIPVDIRTPGGDLIHSTSTSEERTHIDLAPGRHRVELAFVQPDARDVTVTAGAVTSIQAAPRGRRVVRPRDRAAG